MVDLSDKGSSESEDMHSQTKDRASFEGNQVKTCTDCGTTKTPLWRGGPAGPKSLCNACGIRSRKKRRALLGLNKDDKKSSKKINIKNNKFSSNQSNNSSSSSSSNGGNKLGDSLKKKLMEIGREVIFQRPRSTSIMMGKQRRKLGEEEQAAVLLMALSCGSVFA